MSTSVPEPPLSERVPLGLLIASTLSWVWGVLCGFTALAFLLPMLRLMLGPTAIVFAFVFLSLAALYCFAGYLIRKGRLTGGWIGVITAGILAALQFIGGRNRLAPLAGFALNLTIVLLLVLNWRHLHASSSQVGA